MGLFSKKPGGTFVGNLLRAAGAAASSAAGVPGLLGSGANMIPIGGTVTNGQLSQTGFTPAAPGASAALPDGSNNNILLLGGLGLAALFLFSKKR